MEAFDRRSFIKLGSIAAFRWVTLGDVLQQRAMAASRKGDDISVIHLFLTGGMSQMDTFDPKPNSKPEFRSKFETIATRGSSHIQPKTSVKECCGNHGLRLAAFEPGRSGSDQTD